jgi:xanthine dehydrogenase/oxidase
MAADHDEPRFGSEIVFYVNGERVALTDPDPSLLLVDYLRSSGLTGTKLSCGEGGCGACTVMLASFDPAVAEGVVRRSVNACLRPLASIDGMAVTTVEGIGNSRDGLHPLQDRLARCNGSQCGYCSPGFVMTAYAYLRRHDQPTERGIEDAFDGNLCRCTGYRPILQAMRSFATSPPAGGIAADTFPDELRERPSLPLRFERGERTWYRATTLELVQSLKRANYRAPNDPKLVAGNTSIGIYKADAPRVLIDVAPVAELQRLATRDDEPAIEIGGAVTYTRLIEYLAAGKPEPGSGAAALLSLLAQVAGTQVRDEATVGGAVSLLWQHAASSEPFPSDLYTALAGLDATVTLASCEYEGGRRAFAALDLPEPQDWPRDAVVASVVVPLSRQAEHVESYRVARREQNAHALVNACLRVVLDDDGTVLTARLAFGAIAGLPVRARKTEDALAGRRWDADALRDVLDVLHSELDAAIIDRHDGISKAYRLELAQSLFYRFYLRVAERLEPGAVDPRLASGAVPMTRALSTGRDGIPSENAIPKITAPRQTSGEELYTTDIAAPASTLFGALVWSSHGHADFGYRGGVETVLPALRRQFGGVVAYLTAADMPGSYGGIGGDDPVLVMQTATCYGQLIGLVVAHDERVALAAAAVVQQELIEWQPRSVVLGIDGARAQTPPAVLPNPASPGSWLSYEERYTRPGSDEGWIKDPSVPPPGADGVVCGIQRSGLQAHFYMEPQALIAQPTGDGGLVIDASTQSPDSVQGAVMQALELQQNQVRVRMRSLGGGFGGKTTRSPFVAVPIALAAFKLNLPVRLAIDRNVDMAIIGKRHAFEGAYHVAHCKGKVVAMTTSLAADGGNTIDCSYFVIHVAQLHADNCYLVPTFNVDGIVYATNEASNISMRAFGVVQTILAQEDAIEHVAYATGREPEAVREELFYATGDSTHYGEQLLDCTIGENWERLKRDCDFERRAADVQRFNAANRWKKRGIAMIPLKYGAQYEVPALNYGSALVSVFAGDGSVVVQCGGVEVGQGLQTKVAQIAARALGIDVGQVTVADPDTSVTANATSTGADSGADLNGWATYIAAHQLFKRLQAYAAEQEKVKPFSGDTWAAQWPAIVGRAHGDRVDLAAYAFYKTSGVTPDQPYAYYSWSAGCSEVEVDVLTGQVTVLRSDLLVDAGLPLNPLLDLGQAQGAFVQGLGYLFCEEILFDADGRLTTDGTWEYKLPCTKSIPVDFRVSLNVAERRPTRLPIEHTVALITGEGPASFRPDVANLAHAALDATADDPPVAGVGNGAADPALAEQLAAVQVLGAEQIAADPELQEHLDDLTAAALHSAKGIGEPPVALAVSAFLAAKRAVLSARADAGVDGWFQLDAPATVARVREACAVPLEQLRL